MPLRRNVLLLSSGRRVALARAFRACTEDHGATFFAGDFRPELSAACQDNEMSLRLPHAADPQYPEALATVCDTHAIGLVVPTIDTELLLLSRLRAQFLEDGTSIAVSDPELIEIARDKRNTATHFERLGVECPRIFPLDKPEFPAIAKPFDGSLSRDVHILKAPAEYNDRIRAIPNLMLAHYLDPADHDEFTCDAYYDRNGMLRCVVPRLRIEVRGGEISKGRTVGNNIVDLFFDKLSQIEGARGCLTFQFFRKRNTGELFLIELNARFGGGFPLSLAAGANFPRWLYEEWIIEKPVKEYRSWIDGLTMLRFDDHILVRPDSSK